MAYPEDEAILEDLKAGLKSFGKERKTGMSPLDPEQTFSAIQEKARRQKAEFQDAPVPKIHIGMATCGIASGALETKSVFDVCGGVSNKKSFKAVQIGGPSGGCLPSEFLSTPIDFDSLTEAGAMMGSGGMVVMDEDTCMVDVARYFLDFTQKESCGKCTFCRIGTYHLLSILARITRGEGRGGDLYHKRPKKKAVDQSLCVKCGECVVSCPPEYRAVKKVSPPHLAPVIERPAEKGSPQRQRGHD